MFNYYSQQKLDLEKEKKEKGQEDSKSKKLLKQAEKMLLINNYNNRTETFGVEVTF